MSVVFSFFFVLQGYAVCTSSRKESAKAPSRKVWSVYGVTTISVSVHSFLFPAFPFLLHPWAQASLPASHQSLRFGLACIFLTRALKFEALVVCIAITPLNWGWIAKISKMPRKSLRMLIFGIHLSTVSATYPCSRKKANERAVGVIGCRG